MSREERENEEVQPWSGSVRIGGLGVFAQNLKSRVNPRKLVRVESADGG